MKINQVNPRAFLRWFQNWKNQWPAGFLLLLIGNVINGLGTFVVYYLELLLTKERGYPDSIAGLIVSLVGCGAFVNTLFFAWASDRLGRKTVIMVTMGFAGLLSIALGLATPVYLVAPIAFLQGASTNAYGIAMRGHLSDIMTGERRGRAGQLVYWAYNVGLSLAPVVVVLVALISTSYAILFIADGAATLIYLVIAYWSIPNHNARTTSTKRSTGNPFAIWKDKKLILFVLISTVKDIVYIQYSAVLPLSMSDHGLSKAFVGVVMGINAAVVLCLGWMPAPKGWSSSRVLALSAFLIGAGLCLPAFLENQRQTIVVIVDGLALFLMTLGEILSESGEEHWKAEMNVSHRVNMAAFEGAARLHLYIGMAVAPAIGTTVYQFFGDKVLWPLCLLGGTVAAFGYLSMESGILGALRLAWYRVWRHRFAISITLNAVLVALLVQNAFFHTSAPKVLTAVIPLPQSGQQVACGTKYATIALFLRKETQTCYYSGAYDKTIHIQTSAFDQICSAASVGGLLVTYDSRKDILSPYYGNLFIDLRTQLFVQDGCTNTEEIGLSRLAGAVDLQIVAQNPVIPEFQNKGDIASVPCGDRTDFFTLFNQGAKLLCEASAGIERIEPVAFDALCTGHNRGRMDYISDNGYMEFTVYRFDACVGLPDAVTANTVIIYNLDGTI